MKRFESVDWDQYCHTHLAREEEGCLSLTALGFIVWGLRMCLNLAGQSDLKTMLIHDNILNIFLFICLSSISIKAIMLKKN
ncbi:hypothetical protein XENTR_v10013555 [Xenopus tropicalis]|nr:hypothetical protein XENTR_v10013555 [Xenopus tropicalis]